MCVRGCAGRRAHERAQASGRRRARAYGRTHGCACVCAPGSRRACVRMCVCVHEAIFSRFKGLSPFVWYTDPQRISYALRIAPKCFSVPPLVGCGGGLWGWVVCVGAVCSPLPCTWGRVRTYVCVPERTGVRMGVRVRMCARERGLILPTLLYINPLPSA